MVISGIYSLDIFSTALRFVLKWEGDWSGGEYDPQDPGGLTRFGITLKTLIARGIDINRDGRIDRKDLEDLTPDQVAKFYKEHYWMASRCDVLPAALALAVFDASVNQGISRSTKFLQRAAGVTDDGIFGPKTLRYMELGWRKDPATFLRNYHVERALHYSSLAQILIYGRGWFRRLFDVYAEARELM